MFGVGYFVFYRRPIKIETEKWRMDFVSNGDESSTIEIVKYNHLGNRAWSFRIMREEGKLKVVPLVCTDFDPIGKRIYRAENLSDIGVLSWDDINNLFCDITTYLNR